jgi:superfamily II DNA or RNA helicase
VYSFSMEEAIKKDVLTNYMYKPVITELIEEELEEYKHLSKRIGQLMRKKQKTFIEKERLKSLLLRRSMIIQNAENKKGLLYNMLSKQEDKKHTLVYCGKGQVDEIVRELSKLNIRVHRFNWEINAQERKIVLEQFSRGEIEVLVAIKCLDEGVDVPSTRVAYFLASTSNPREFIQRRGRILRKAVNKQQSIVNDFIVFPHNDESFDTVKGIATKEMPRFAEFSRFALNEYEARKSVLRYLDKYHLSHLMSITPWEMYDLLRKEGELE